ncbi:MAG: GNAT family N-acetyltransferase [Bacteroidia bacterium]|nr:GNAT family N-acetyltransferase [Bacteroidia bacterium]
MNFNFSKDIILENERAILRPLTMQNLHQLLPVATENEKLVQFSPVKIHSEPLLKKHIELALEERAFGIRYAFSIFDKKENAFAGSTSFGMISNKDDKLHIGWTWIGKKFQRTGLNRNCKLLLLTYAFEELKCHRVDFQTDERNTVSRTAIEKLGATFEGILREDILMTDGFRRSSVYYSILASEWPKIKNKLLRSPV